MKITQFISEHGWSRDFLIIVPEISVYVSIIPEFYEKMLYTGMKVIKKSPRYFELPEIYSKIRFARSNYISDFYGLNPDMIFIHDMIIEHELERIMNHFGPKGTIVKFFRY